MDPEIVKRLDALGEKLGATGQYLWDALVRGCFASGAAWAACFFLLAAISGKIALGAKKVLKPLDPRSIALMSSSQLVLMISTIAAVGFTLASFANLVDALAPERAAIKIIFGK